MNREELLRKFSQVVGLTKADEIVSEAETTLGFEDRDNYTGLELRDLCEEIGTEYDGYIAEIADEIRIHTQAQDRFETLLENVPDPAVVVGFPESVPTVRTVNSAFEDVFGYDRAEIQGTPLSELIVPEDAPAGMELWRRDDTEAEREVTRVTADGDERTFLFRTAMETTIGGEIEGYGVYTDITERIERERNLDMLKQVFSRVFRHNIRNELTVVNGHLGMVAEHPDEEIANYAQIALDATDRLLSHTEKARDIEKVVDRDQNMTRRSVHEIVSEAIAVQETDPEECTIRNAAADVAVDVVAGFETAVANAIENAIAHNPSPVSIEIRTEASDDTVDLYIVDDGVGISPAETAVLDAEQETSLAHGSGVGLWVMKWYVENSDGQLSVSGDHSGTTVRMTLNRA